MADEPTQGQDTQSAQESKAEPRTYTEAEVEKRLRGQAKEMERLQSIAAEFEKAKSAQAKRDADAAAKRGEFEKLYVEAEAKVADYEKQLERERAARERYESHLSNEVTSTLDSIEDKDKRKRWSELLDAEDVLKRRTLLQELMAASGSAPEAAPRAPRTAPAGKKSGDLDFDVKRTVNDPVARQAVVMEILRRAKEGRAGE